MAGATVVEDVTNDRTVALSPPPLPSPPGRNIDNMYVVQFPQDQVYRVPPLENAEFMEKYRNSPPKETKSRRRNCCCACPRVWIAGAYILAAVVAVFCIIVASLFFIYNPTGPTFSVTRVAVKNGTKHAPPKYEISLKARNTNEKLRMVYEKSEVALLVDDSGAKIAAGKFPRMEQNHGASTPVKILLTGTGGALPKSVEFDLEMRLRVRVSAGGISTWPMTASVVCVFEVSGLGKSTRILSQKCDTKLRYY